MAGHGIRSVRQGAAPGRHLGRNHCDDTGAAPARSDPQVAAELLQAGPHGRDADAEPDRSIWPGRGCHAVSVVGDADGQISGHDSGIDRHVRGAGVPMHVGESLLHHAQDRPLHVRRQLVDLLRNPDRGDKLRPLHEAFGKVPHRGLESVLLQVRWMQQVGEDAQLPQRLGEQTLDLSQDLPARRALPDLGLRARQSEVRRHEVLRRRGMQLAGDTLPLLLLKGEQWPGQCADLLFAPVT